MSSITKAVSCYNAVRYLKFLSKTTQSITSNHAFFHTSSYLNVKGQEIKMPSLSPTMAEGKIVKWLKKEGDTISPGDVLCDIETDKAVVSMETEEEGVLAKIIVKENTKTVSVGSLIALMVSEGENWQDVEVPSESGAAPVKKEAGEEPKPLGPPCIQVKMPSLSPTMTAGTILKWYKKEGEAIASGDILCDIQTDKAVISFESDEDGIIAKILISEGTKEVNVGTLIALIVGEGEDWQNAAVPQTISTTTQVTTPDNAAQPCDAPSSPEQIPDTSGKTFGPAVRSLLTVYQLDASQIQATGRNNMLLKGDVLKYVEDNKLQKKPPKPISLPTATSQPPQPVSTPPDTAGPNILTPAVKSNVLSQSSHSFGRRSKGEYIDIELTNVRKVIAKRLTESKQRTPHVYGQIICQADDLIALRKDLISQGLTASLNDYIIKATAYALEACPRVNVICMNNEYKHSPTIDISVAVATPNGLITPIITDVARKTVSDISETIKEMVPRARAGKLKPNEFQGGSFTISNLGMFGIKHFTAIINPPQCAILAVGGAIDRFGPDRKTHHDIAFTLSYDRRALEEDEAAEFLDVLRSYIENPRQLVAENISMRRTLGL